MTQPDGHYGTPLERAWEAYGGVLPSRGQKANCPLHEDHTASAVVNPETGKWKCYAGCGRGDVYDLIKAAEADPSLGPISFRRAKEIAEEKFGAAPGRDGSGGTKKRPGRKGAWVPPWLR